MSEIYEDIPTYENKKWTITSFESREDFAEFIKDLFKQPGEYLFNELTSIADWYDADGDGTVEADERAITYFRTRRTRRRSTIVPVR